MLRSRLPPRTRAREIWRIPPEHLEQAQDDATLIAVHDLERAGLDIITDGEIRRESYSNRFATALDGMDVDNPGTAIDRTGSPTPVPAVRAAIRRRRPVEVRDVRFLRDNTERQVKITVPGPFTMAQQAQDEHYHDKRALALDLAAAVNEEVHDLFAAGADVVQIDEPYLQARPEEAREYAVDVIDRALDGVQGSTALHTCFGYAHLVHDRPPGYSFLAELNDCYGCERAPMLSDGASPAMSWSYARRRSIVVCSEGERQSAFAVVSTRSLTCSRSISSVAIWFS